jgi:NADH-quinone oxidoreductase subunit C
MILERLKEKFGAEVLATESVHGEDTIVITREAAPKILGVLHNDAEFACEFLLDLTAVDWLTRTPRFEVVYHLRSMSRNFSLRVKIPIEGQDAWVPSATPLWKSANWLERECFDMFGIDFKGHPDLRRILLYDTFVGHPLRKDYPYQKRQSIVPEIDPILNPIRSSK